MDHHPARPVSVLFVTATSAANPLLTVLAEGLAGRVSFRLCAFDGEGPLDEQAAGLGLLGVEHLADVSGRSLPRAVVQLRRLLHRTRPDIVHANHVWPGLVTELARLGPGAPPSVFTRHHDHSHRVLGKPLHARIDGWTARRASIVVAPSAAVQRSLIDLEGVRPDRVVVIHHGVDWQRLDVDDADVARVRATLPSGRLAVAAGRLDPIKSYADLFAAVAIAAKDVPDLRLAVAGTGSADARARLEADIDAAGVRERVVLLGHRSDLPAVLRAADVFVQASLSESFGLSILEAAGLGVPLAVTTPGGVPEIVGDLSPLVPPGDPSALAERIVDVLADDNAKRRAEDGAAAIRTRFAPDRMAAAHLAVYRGLAPGHAR